MNTITASSPDDREEALIPLANSGHKLAEDGMFSVWQNDQYRWLQDGDAIQSVMSRAKPADLVLPNHRYMFVALALADMRVDSSRKVLNLGFGLGAIERKLTTSFPNISTTSVEASSAMVEFAKKYFFIDPDCKIEVAEAETFIAQTDDKFDLAIIDLFAQSKNAPCVYDRGFYRQIKRCLNAHAWLSLNVIPDSEPDLLAVLLPLRECFRYVAMAKIPQRENIVLVANDFSDFGPSGSEPDIAAFGFDVRELLDQFTLLPLPGEVSGS